MLKRGRNSNLEDRINPRVDVPSKQDKMTVASAMIANLGVFFTEIAKFYGPNVYPNEEPIGHLDPSNVLWVSSADGGGGIDQ